MKKQFLVLVLGIFLSIVATITYTEGQQGTFKETIAHYISRIKQLFNPSAMKSEKQVIEQPKRPILLAERPAIAIAFYDYKNNILTLKKDISDTSSLKPDYFYENSFKEVKSYSFSPRKKFLLVNGTKNETSLFSIQYNAILKRWDSVITFEFNADETRLLILIPHKSFLENKQYQLIDTSSGELIISLPSYTQSAFFDVSGELVAIDSQNNKIRYSAVTGIEKEQFFDFPESENEEIETRPLSEEEIKKTKQMKEKETEPISVIGSQSDDQL